MIARRQVRMTSSKYRSNMPEVRVRMARRVGIFVGAVLFLGLLLFGASWLLSVVGTESAVRSAKGQQKAPSVVPALAQIPWHNNPCRPKRMQLYTASLPGYSPRMAAPWWWTQVHVAPAGNPLVSGLLKALCRTDARRRVRGLQQFTVWIRRVRWKAYPPIQRTLLPAVLRAGHYRTALRMTRLTILLDPANTGWLQFMLVVRTQVLLAAKCPNRALNNALRLYNVCTMRDVRQAVVLIAQCLQSGAMGGGVTARHFVAGQIHAQYVPPMAEGRCSLPVAFRHYGHSSGGQVAMGDDGMAAAWRRLNPQPYGILAGRITGEDFHGLMQRGNLLLLANHCRQAALVWDRAYAVAEGAWQLRDAAEGIARTIKAIDKTIAPANRWVNEVRFRGAKRR